MKNPKDFLRALQETEFIWIATRKDPALFVAVFQREHVQLKLNDFPEEPMGTVFLS